MVVIIKPRHFKSLLRLERATGKRSSSATSNGFADAESFRSDQLLDAAQQVSYLDYRQAVEVLRLVEGGTQGGEAMIRSANPLIRRCLRLAADRQRLEVVLDGLERDEYGARQELLALLGADTPPHPYMTVEPEPDLLAATGSSLEPQTVSEGAERARTGAERNHDPPCLAIWLLGGFKVTAQGHVVVGQESDKGSTVFRFLATLAPPGAHKEQLAAKFWPEADTRTARRNLHQAIYSIRRMLGRFGAESELVFANDHYKLGGSPRPWRDVDELTKWVETARSARRAGDDSASITAFRRADLVYTGEFLADYPYDEWAVGQREHFRTLHREAGAALLASRSAEDDHCSVLQLATRLLTFDPCDEDACRHLMKAHFALGQAHLATMAFIALSEHLDQVLELQPSQQTIDLARTLIGRGSFS